MQLKRFLGNVAKAYLVIGALSVSAFAGADEYHNFNSCAPVCTPICPPCGPSSSCCGSPCNEAPVCSWGYNPPAYTRCGCDTGCGGLMDSLSFRADFLWWRANEEGLSLGTEEFVETFENSAGPVRNTVINRSHSKRPNYKYDPGFRIGLANYCACDCWDIALNWTHFHTKANVNGASDLDNGVEFFSDWERVVDADATVASGRYTLNLDLVDLELGRKFYVSSCFVLRPQFGLRIARIDQNYRVESESSEGPETSLSDFVSDVKSRSDFLSVGPRVGVDIEVHLGCGLALFGQAAGSIVFGKFDNHSRERLTDFTTASTAQISDFEYEANSSAHRCSRTITDFAVGIKWERCFDWCNRMHPVSLAFAWEHHAFYDMNNFNFVERGFDFNGAGSGVANGSGLRKHGNLYTQGLTVTASFGF